MGKKKSRGIKYQTEEEALNYLKEFVETRKKKHSLSRGTHLDKVPAKLRSAGIYDFILSHSDFFNIPKEMKYMSFKSFSEEDLMMLLFKHPNILYMRNSNGEHIFKDIKDIELPFPVNLAIEIGEMIKEHADFKSIDVNSVDVNSLLVATEYVCYQQHGFYLIPDWKKDLNSKLDEIKEKYNSKTSAEEVFKENIIPLLKEVVNKYEEYKRKKEQEEQKQNDGAISPKDIAETSIANKIPTSAIPQNMEGIEAVSTPGKIDNNSREPLSNTMEAREDR